MSTLTQLQPNKLWRIFDKICSIPHPSKHEQKISFWIQAWATELGLSVKEDAIGNLIIKKPATAGMENKKGVILQAHMDMVPQKNSATDHDFRTDPIKPYIIPIPLSYCSLVLVKIAQGCVALNPNSQLLLNRAPYLELFFLRTTRSQT